MSVTELLMKTLACVLSLVMSVTVVTARRNKAAYCGACIGLVEEMHYGLLQTDDTQKLQVGSFRLDSQGKQALNKIPYKYTELHLTELLEESCEQVGHYAASQKEGTNIMNYIRTDSRDGRPISLKNININSESQRLLKFACDTIVEEHEDEIIALYKQKEQDINKKLCVQLSGLCSEQNITDYTEAIEDMLSMDEEVRPPREEEDVDYDEEGSDLSDLEAEEENDEEFEEDLDDDFHFEETKEEL